MRIRPHLVALILSLVILLVSGLLAVDYSLASSMAYYGGLPARTQQMHSLQHYADIWGVVFVFAAVASIFFGVLAYRRRRRAQTRVLNESHVA
jgi:type II secretory pathway component PulF